MKKITKFFIAVITVTSILLLCTACTDNIATPDEKGDIENPSEPSEPTPPNESTEPSEPTPPTEPTNPSDPENPPVDEATIRKNNIAAAIAKNYDNDTVLYKQTEEGITKSDLYKNDGDFSYIKWDRGNGVDFLEYIYEFDSDGYLKIKYYKNIEDKWVISDDPEYYVKFIDLSVFTADDFRYLEGKYFIKPDKLELAMSHIFKVSSVTYVPDEVNITLDENNVIKTIYAKTLSYGEENIFEMEISDVGSTVVTTPEYENIVTITHTDKTVTVGESIVVSTLFNITEQGENKEIKEEMINEGNLNLNEPGVYTVTITYVSRDKKTYSDAATITVKKAETEVNLTFEQIFAAAKTQGNLTFTAKDGKIYKQAGDTVVLESNGAATMYVFYKDGGRKAVNGNTLYLKENYKAAMPNIKEITEIAVSEFTATEESNVYEVKNSAAVVAFIKKYAPQFGDRINEENCSVKIKIANNKITEITVSYEYKMTANAKKYTAKTDVYSVSDCGTTVINVPDEVTAKVN